MKKSVWISLGTLFLGCAVQATPASEPAAKSSAEKKPEAFNPVHCKSGSKDYVYWAARDNVFRFKFNPAEPIYPIADADRVGLTLHSKGEDPVAPNPNESEGCYGNPLRFGLVPYMSSFDQELFQKITGRKLDTGTAGLRGYTSIPNDRRNTGLNKLIEQWFSESKICWKRASGIDECIPANTVDKDDYKTSHYFKIDKKLLPKHPQVEDVYLVLGHDAAAYNKQNGKEIQSSLELFGNVSLKSSFRIFPNEIDLLIPYYSGLINYVLQAHVPNYRWPSTQTK